MPFATLPRLAALGAAAAMLIPTASARAQEPASDAPRSEESVCLGFAFGGFTPKLDWEKAGHRPVRDTSTLQHAPGGRDWASDVALRSDSALYLFPAWWPVGILVQVPNRKPASGDTVSGTATALVASGEIIAPVARVKAWRVPCSGSSRPSSADSARAGEKNPQKNPAASGTRPVTPGILRRSP